MKIKSLHTSLTLGAVLLFAGCHNETTQSADKHEQKGIVEVAQVAKKSEETVQKVSEKKTDKNSLDAHETALSSNALKPFINDYCISCHGTKKQKGDTRFDHLDYVISDNLEAVHYQDILDVLNSAEMPPEDDPQPSKETIEVVIRELTEGLFTARKQLASTGGKVTMRRLTRREYGATMRHLFGLEPESKQIPPDEGVENFDTVGVRQDFNSKHLDHYYDLAKKVLSTSFKLAGTRKAFEVNEQHPESFWNTNFQRFLDEHKNKPKSAGKVYRLSRMREAYFRLPNTETGVYLGEPLRHLTYSFRIDPRAKYKISVKSGIHGQVAPFRRFVRLATTKDEELAGVILVNGTEDKPTESTIEVIPKTLNSKIGGYVAEDRSGAWLSHYLKFIQRYEGVDAKNEGLIWIDSFKCEGPYYPEERSFFDKLLCPDEPTAKKPSKIVWNDDNARELIEKFTVESFRQKRPSVDFFDGLHDFYKNQKSLGLNFQEAMIETLAVVLSSPSFLFLNEDNQKEVTAQDKAIRISYFLTSSQPDLELMTKVNSASNAVIRKEIDRLLEKSDYRDFSEGFASQWADFVRFENITVNPVKYPTYNRGLRYSMKQEVIHFFQEMLRQNLPISNLIKSDFVTVNAQLATLYDIPNIKNNSFEKITLAENSPRGGFLSQGLFLMAGSNGDRSSPTIRGMMAMNRIMNKTVPPPPPNVPELGSDVKNVLTNRELVELHQSQVQCASCHREMDSVGLAFENFDVIGRWRGVERMTLKDKAPVKISGSLEGKKPFNNYLEFKNGLLSYEESLARNMVESLLVYGLGRDIEFTDTPHIDAILEKVRSNNYRIKDMIYAVVESPLFVKN
ncbi:MAG: DUF1588 domain-containing protein [Lentisphaeraceae bacterium]|nr:DUF1588 domain-containing protein [Lentisphaeraceae bacterium]